MRLRKGRGCFMAKKTLPGFEPKPEAQSAGRFDWVEDARRDSEAHARQLAERRVSDAELAGSLDGLARSCDAERTMLRKTERKGVLFKKEVSIWEKKPDWVQDRDAYLAEQPPEELARACLRGLFGRSVDRMTPGMMSACCDTPEDFQKTAEALGGLTAAVDAAAGGPEPVSAGISKDRFFGDFRKEMKSAYDHAEKAGRGPEFMGWFMTGASRSNEYLSRDASVSGLIRGYMPDKAVAMMEAMERGPEAMEREREAGKARWDFGPAPGPDASPRTRRGIPDYVGPQAAGPGQEAGFSL